jgi:hypothetical protein
VGGAQKEIKQGILTSEQLWHKNVDNIWVKIMNAVGIRMTKI